MERGLKDPKKIKLSNPLITKGNENRLLYGYLYNIGKVGVAVYVFFKNIYSNVTIGDMFSDTCSISLYGNKYS